MKHPASASGDVGWIAGKHEEFMIGSQVNSVQTSLSSLSFLPSSAGKELPSRQVVVNDVVHHVPL